MFTFSKYFGLRQNQNGLLELNYSIYIFILKITLMVYSSEDSNYCWPVIRFYLYIFQHVLKKWNMKITTKLFQLDISLMILKEKFTWLICKHWQGDHIAVNWTYLLIVINQSMFIACFTTVYTKLNYQIYYGLGLVIPDEPNLFIQFQ